MASEYDVIEPIVLDKTVRDFNDNLTGILNNITKAEEKAAEASNSAEQAINAAMVSSQKAEEAKEYRDSAAAIVTPEGLAAKVNKNTDDISDVKNAYMQSGVNLFDERKLDIGHGFNEIGAYFTDNRYALTDVIKVPAHKRVLIQCDVNGQTKINGARFVSKTTQNGEFVSALLDNAYKYLNNSEEDIYIRATLYYNVAGVSYINFLIRVIDETEPVIAIPYEPFKYHVNEERVKIKSVEDLKDTVELNSKKLAVVGKNLYSEHECKQGYYVDVTNGVAFSDVRYKTAKPLLVKSGETIYMTAIVNNSSNRRTEGSCRSNVVYSLDGKYLKGSDTMATCWKYTNDSSNSVYVVFNAFLSHPSYNNSYEFIGIVQNSENIDASFYEETKYAILNDADLYNMKNELKVLDDKYMAQADRLVSEIHSATVYNPSLTYLWISDCHEYPWDINRTKAMNTNVLAMKKIAEKIHLDGVINTGDIIDQRCFTVQNLNDAQIYEICAEHYNKFKGIGDKFLYTAGNHDGRQANIPKEQELYYNVGAKSMKQYMVMPNYPACYGYVDHEDIKTRIIMVGIPDGTIGLGISPRQLQWLADNAFNTPNDYGVILAFHIPTPFLSWLEPNGFPNRVSFEGLVNAYHNHSAYSDSNVTCDFTNKQGCKVVVALVGHVHEDDVIEIGEEYIDDMREKHDYYLTNNLPCKQVVIEYGINVCFDAVVYLPNSHLLKTFRFNNAAKDRVIAVN